MTTSNTSKVVSVAILSDTHCYLDPNVANVVSQCDIAVHAGDIGCAEVLKSLNPRLKKTIAVLGNNDQPYIWNNDEVHILESMDFVAEVDLPGGKLVVEHGDRFGMHDSCHRLLRNAYPQARVIVYGHTHKIVCDQTETPWVVNPGAAGKIRTGQGPSCLVLNASADSWSLKEKLF